MKSKITLVALSAFLFAACDTGPTVIPALVPAQNAAYQQKGTGGISGEAYVRDDQGQVQPGGHCLISLFPATPYYTAWVKAKLNKESPPMDATARSYIHATVSDNQGNFTFSGLPDGAYVLYANLTLSAVASAYIQGGDPSADNSAASTALVTTTVQITGGQIVKVELH